MGDLLPSGSDLAKCVVWEVLLNSLNNREKKIYPRKLARKYGGTRQAWENQFGKLQNVFIYTAKLEKEERYKGGDWRLKSEIKEDLKNSYRNWREVYRRYMVDVIHKNNLFFCFACKVLHLISRKRRTAEEIIGELKPQEEITENIFRLKRLVESVIRIFSPFLEIEYERGKFYFQTKEERALPILMSDEWTFKWTKNGESTTRLFWVDLSQLSEREDKVLPDFKKHFLEDNKEKRTRVQGGIPSGEIGGLTVPKMKVKPPFVQFWWTGNALKCPPGCDDCKEKEHKVSIKGEAFKRKVNRQNVNQFKSCSRKVRDMIGKLRLEKHSRDVFVFLPCEEGRLSVFNENLTRFIPTSFS